MGVSAFKGKNAVEGKLKAFIDAVDRGTIREGSILLVESLDRISRVQVHEALPLFLSILKRGITIVTLVDEEVYSVERFESDNGISLIISIMYMMRAHNESAMKSVRIKAKWDHKRQSWKPGDPVIQKTAPSWLKLNKDGNGWDIIHGKAEVVRRIYEMAHSGMGGIKIMHVLEKEGVPTMSHAEHWTQGVIGALLRKSAVMGTFTQKRGGDLVIEDYYPTIVPKEQWLFVQDAIRSRKTTGGVKSDKVSNLLSGISFCLYCGSRTRFVPTLSGYAYVRCLRAYSKNKECSAPPFPYKAAEKALLNRLMNVQQRIMDNRFVVKGIDKRVIMTEQIEQLRDRQTKVVAMLFKMPDVKPLEAELQKLQEQINQVEKELSGLAVSRVTHEEHVAATELFSKHQRLLKEDPDSEELAEIRRGVQASIRRFIDKVEFGSDFADSKLFAEQGEEFFANKKFHWYDEDPSNYILQVTFASKNVRIIDATEFVVTKKKREGKA